MRSPRPRRATRPRSSSPTGMNLFSSRSPATTSRALDPVAAKASTRVSRRLCGLIPAAYTKYRSPARRPTRARAAATSSSLRGRKTGSGAWRTMAISSVGTAKRRAIAVRDPSETVKRTVALRTASRSLSRHETRARLVGDRHSADPDKAALRPGGQLGGIRLADVEDVGRLRVDLDQAAERVALEAAVAAAQRPPCGVDPDPHLVLPEKSLRARASKVNASRAARRRPAPGSSPADGTTP